MVKIPAEAGTLFHVRLPTVKSGENGSTPSTNSYALEILPQNDSFE